MIEFDRLIPNIPANRASEPSACDIYDLFRNGFEHPEELRRQKRRIERDRILREMQRFPAESAFDRARRAETLVKEAVSQEPALPGGRPSVRLAVLVFGRPTNKLFAEYVQANRSYLNGRSSIFVDIVTIGFRSDLNYYETDFLSLVRDFETQTKWRYSGDTDLLMFNLGYTASTQKVIPDFTTAITFTLESVAKSGLFAGVNGFFEELIRFCESFEGENPTWAFSDLMGAKHTRSVLIQLLLKLLPKEAADGAKALKDLAVRDVSTAL